MTRFARLFLLLGIAAALHAQTPPIEVVPPSSLQPYRLEIGGYGSDFTNGGGWWRGVNSTLWIRKSSKFIPAFTFDNRTINSVTQRYYSFFSYANWTPNFFTTQAVSGTAASGEATALLFPRLRYDGKAWWKLPPRRRLVAGLGATRFTLGGGINGLVVNPGIVYYGNSWVLDWEGFVNQTHPGGFWSTSGLFAIQQGQEGKRLAGVSIGVGRQVYQEILNVPIDIRYNSFSVDPFYRRWITRKFGIVISGGYQDAIHTFQRFSIASGIFFEF